MVATAIIGAAVVGAAGTAVAGSEAAGATGKATNAAIGEQNTILGYQQAVNAPYQALATGTPGTPATPGRAAVPGSPGTPGTPGAPGFGIAATPGTPATAGTPAVPASAGTPGTTGAISQYENLLGLGPAGVGGIESALASTPGYQFAKSQGLTATENAATASGMGLSGNTLEALDTFSTGLADSTYQNAVGNAQSAVEIGQASAAGQAANLGAAGSNISNALIGQGANLAGIDANTVAGITKAASGGAGQYATYNTLQNLINAQGAGSLTEFTPTNYGTLGGGP